MRVGIQWASPISFGNSDVTINIGAAFGLPQRTLNKKNFIIGTVAGITLTGLVAYGIWKWKTKSSSESGSDGTFVVTKNMNFGLERVPEITDDKLEFLSQYTKEKDLNKLRAHVKAFIEDIRASKLHVYRCIQTVRFLQSKIQKTKSYEEIIKRIDSIEVADLGCAFGQETRRLILDGIPAKKITALDLHDGYWKLGQTLFMDTDKISNQVDTVFGDFAKPASQGGIDIEQNKLSNRFDYAFAFAVLHCLSQTQVEEFVSNVFKILKPNSKAKFFGNNVGMPDQPGNEVGAQTPDGQAERFWHTAESLEKLLTSKGFVNVKVEARPHNADDRIGAESFSIEAHGKKAKSIVRVLLSFSAEKP
jgi:SAM-dependent methyltransferase